MKERGIATKIEGTNVSVRIVVSEGCASCQSKDGCASEGRVILAKAPDGMPLAVGDLVDIFVPESAMAAGLLWLVVIPVGLFLAGYLAMGSTGAGEGLQALGGISGFGLGLLAAVFVARKSSMGARPEILPSGALDVDDCQDCC
ncbi:MAG: SoxR reducing system RseC family protein [Spirochaetia bacterium]|jgi:positive regulator of sigma E activity|nr:SoxR reducing system RseC family protein [Spirochaetia bacterium]